MRLDQLYCLLITELNIRHVWCLKFVSFILQAYSIVQTKSVNLYTNSSKMKYKPDHPSLYQSLILMQNDQFNSYINLEARAQNYRSKHILVGWYLVYGEHCVHYIFDQTVLKMQCFWCLTFCIAVGVHRVIGKPDLVAFPRCINNKIYRKPQKLC